MSMEAVQEMPQDLAGTLKSDSAPRGRLKGGRGRAKAPRADAGPPKVFAYLRVSSHEQRDHGLGLEVQREAVEDYCRKRGWVLAGVFEDAGVSGAGADEEEMVVNRPGLRRMLASIDGEPIRYIVVLNTSRLWRSDATRFIIQRELRRLGVDVKAVEQPRYSIHRQEPSDYLANAMQEVLDSYMRLELVTKLSRGRLAAARRGQFAGGGVAYGYSNVRGSKALMVNLEEAAVVKRIFGLARRGMTAYRIAHILNEKGVRTRQGREWTHRQVGRILAKRRFYQGKVYVYGGLEVKATHPPILG
jgi:site-specific DNA recombinase